MKYMKFGNRKTMFYAVLWMLFLPFFQCKEYSKKSSNDTVQLILDWNKMLLNLVQTSEGYRPPVSGRMYCYMGLSLWECNRFFNKDLIELSTLFPDFKLPVDSVPLSIVRDAVINANYERMVHHFFPHAIMSMHKSYQSFYESNRVNLLSKYSKWDIEQSEDLGIKIADAIFEFSKLDKIGHQSFAFNFDQNYTPRVGDGQWVSLDSMPALLPHWGQAKWFLLPPDSIKLVPPIEFSNERSSEFFSQALEVFTISRPLTSERRWIAEFWSDDFHGITFCAVSRWISILIQYTEQNPNTVEVLVETLFRMGLALNDATVFVWSKKYIYNVERPDTYIRRNVNKNWEPLHHTPNFPSYPSGHATFGAAAGEVLKAIFGNKIQFTDRSHETKKEFNGTPRKFATIDAMVNENALSRLYLGVHYRMDCEEGLNVGKIIGKKAVELSLLKNQVKN